MIPLPIDALRIREVRPDLQEAFEIDTPEGRESLLWWYFCHGHREVPVQGEDDDKASAFVDMPQEGIKQASFAPITRLIYQLVARSAPAHLRSGLRKRRPLLQILRDLFTHGTDGDAQEAVLAWYFMHGLVEANLETMLTASQAAALLELGQGSVTRFENLIWKYDPEPRRRFSGPADPAYGRWIRADAAGKYRLLSHPSIGLALEPRRPGRPLSKGRRPFGVNLYGHAGARLGVGEDVRMAALALDAADVPYRLQSISAGAVPDEEPTHASPSPPIDYAFNLFCMTGLETFNLAQQSRRALFDGHFNIGFWPWELSEWPAVLQGSFDLVDEVWASSRFTADSFEKSAPCPVRHLPMAVVTEATEGLSRQDFGLPERDFLFGFALDGSSSIARKNPLACIQAFQSGFPNDTGVGLVIKAQRTQGRPGWSEISAAAQADRRIYLLEGSYPRGRLLDLYRNLDAFVSLHRSEGFGRNIAEAMAVGKPVIATSYSGNLDFTTPETALLVPASSIPVQSGQYQFGDGLKWAEPDLARAAEAMVMIRGNAGLRTKLADAGRLAVSQRFAPGSVGEKYRLVLERIFAEGGPQQLAGEKK